MPRRPLASIRSIVDLFAKKEAGELYADPVEAARYYLERLQWLASFASDYHGRYFYFDAETLVGHLDGDHAVVLVRRDVDGAPVGRVLERVADEVHEHLPDAVAVGRHRVEVGRRVDGDFPAGLSENAAEGKAPKGSDDA